MSFSVNEVSVDKVPSSRGKTAKAVIEALVNLCPKLSMEKVLEDTDEKYGVILRVCETDIAIKAYAYNSCISFYIGKLSDGAVIEVFSYSTSYGLLDWAVLSSFVTINMHTMNGAAHCIDISAPGCAASIRLTVGLLTSRHDAKARPFSATYLQSPNANSVVLTDRNMAAAILQPSSTLSGHHGVEKNSAMPMLILAPCYLDCAQQFLGLPTIGGGETYWTSQSFTPYNQYTMNGKKYYFLSSNICVDVD